MSALCSASQCCLPACCTCVISALEPANSLPHHRRHHQPSIVTCQDACASQAFIVYLIDASLSQIGGPFNHLEYLLSIQMQELEAQLESTISHSERQVAAAQRQAAEAIQKAEAAAARGGAEAVAGSVERETAMNRNLAGLRADLEVRHGCLLTF